MSAQTRRPTQFSANAKVDPAIGASFAWVADNPQRNLVTGQIASGALTASSRTIAALGPAINLSTNSGSLLFSAPPEAAYTVMCVFATPGAVVPGALVRHGGSVGWRFEVFNSGGGIYTQATNNGVVNGPQLVIASSSWDRSSVVAITTYDGAVIRSWMAYQGQIVTGSTSGSLNAISSSDSIEVGCGVSSSAHVQAIVLVPRALPQAKVLQLLVDPLSTFVLPRRLWAVQSQTAPTLSDSAAGTDAAALAAAIAATDTCVATDTTTTAAALALTDSCVGADAVSISQGGTAVPVSDSAAGSDAIVLLAAIADSETGSGADTTAISASLPTSDTSIGADVVAPVVVFASTDGSTGFDQAALNALQDVFDGISGSDATSTAATVIVPDTAAGSDSVLVDTGNPDASFGRSDYAAGTDVISVDKTDIPSTAMGSGGGGGGGTHWSRRKTFRQFIDELFEEAAEETVEEVEALVEVVAVRPAPEALASLADSLSIRDVPATVLLSELSRIRAALARRQAELEDEEEGFVVANLLL